MRVNTESAQPTFFPEYELPELLPDFEEVTRGQVPLDETASPAITAEEDDLMKQPTCYQKGGCDKPCRAAGFCMGVGED